MKLGEITRLAGVSRATAGYVVSGKAKRYRVSDKTVEEIMAVVCKHNYRPNAVVAGLCAGCTRSIELVIPDLENTSYTRITNYLERQARQHGYQLLIACSEDQPDNEMRYIEYPLQRQVDATIMSTSLPPEHPFYQRWANSSFPIVALDRALDREYFINVVDADQGDTEMLAGELRRLPAETVLYLGALPRLSVNSLREQGFRTVWRDDLCKAHFLYANSYEWEAAAQLFDKWLRTHPMPQALFTMSFVLLQGMMDVALRRDEQLSSDSATATFDDHELLNFLQCPALAVAQRHRDVTERVLEIVLANLDEPCRLKPGLTRIRCNLHRRDILNRNQVSSIDDVGGISL